MSSGGSRDRILDAALGLIRVRGDARVTMAQIAKAARLSRQAVYLHFADRAELMAALARRVHERLGLPAAIQRMMAETPTGVGLIAADVSMQARFNPAVWAVARAVDAVRRTDTAAARAWQERLESRLKRCRAIVSRLKTEGSLRPGLAPAIAADLLWTMTSLRMWEDLVLERKWSPVQYQRYVTNILIGALTSSAREDIPNGVDGRKRTSLKAPPAALIRGKRKSA
jgi:AcrR family transcriptional regulator